MHPITEVEPTVNPEDLRASMRTVRATLLPKPGDPMRGLLLGETTGMSKGVGYDIDSLREYREGDESRLIDQRATARNTEGKIIVRENTPEIHPRLWLATDAPSDRYRHGSGYFSEQTLALSALVTVGLSAEAQGVPTGIMAANEYNIFAHRAVQGGKRRIEDSARKFSGLAEQSTAYRAQGVQTEGLNPLSVVLSRATEFCRQNVIVILSDFRSSDPEGSEGWRDQLKQLKKAGNFLIAIETTNPWDFSLPEEISRFRNGKAHYIGERDYAKIAEKYSELAVKQQAAIDEALKAAQVVHIRLSTTEPRWGTHLKTQMRAAAKGHKA